MSDMPNLPAPLGDAAALERQLEAVRDMLAACVTVDDARGLADQAAAMQVYARRARLSREALNYAAEVKLRAERRVGELLDGMIQRGGAPKAHAVTLADLGVQRMQSQRWQAIARIPADVFEGYLAKYRRGQSELVSKALYDLARQYRPPASVRPLNGRGSTAPSTTPPSDGPIPGWDHALYYADHAAGIYLYCADARAVAPLVQADTLITDPPYGVELGTSKTTTGLFKNGRAGYEHLRDTEEEWRQLVRAVIIPLLGRVRRAAVFTGPHYADLPEALAIGGIYCPAAMGRHAWGFKTFLPVLFYGKDPRQARGEGCHPVAILSNETAERNGHPCPKPLEWMRWLVGRASAPDDVIVDPFAGSGTTLRAAKDWGRRAIGIEVHEPYCAIAAERLAQAVLPWQGPPVACAEAVPWWPEAEEA